LIAYLNIDEVIKIIRENDEPKPVLMKRFKLSDMQAEAILELKLRHLARLEEMKIRGEQDTLKAEAAELKKTLGSQARMKTLVKKELKEFQDSARGRSNQPAMFLDSTGRVYSVASHGLPSARSLGEPLASKVKSPDGAFFVGVLMGDDESRFLFATSSGYGFVGKLGAMSSRNKSGKAVLSVPKGSVVLTPQRVNADVVVAIGTDGKMLMFPVADLPELAKGKGNKILAIPKAGAKESVKLQAVRVLGAKNSLKIISGKRHTTLKPRDLEHYRSDRGKRGLSLPRGFQKVADVIVE